MNRLGYALKLVSPIMLAVGSPAYAGTIPDFYTMESASLASWWKAESRILVRWNNDKPVMRGFECVISHDREGTPPMEVAMSHPVESASYEFRFKFDLADDDLINRKVETITVGGRPYQRKVVQSRIIPAFGVHGPDDIVLAYGIGRDMFRPNDEYPWLPLEFLIPQFFEVEGIFLGISGEFEIKHGEYEKRYESVYVDMDGFKETMKWCYDEINPSGQRDLKLPPELKRHLGK